MRPGSERAPPGALGRLARGVAWAIAVLVVAAFPLTGTVVAVAALPLATLLAVSRPATARERAVAAIAGGFAVWWLLRPGELPGQLVRAAAVTATAAFVVMTLTTRVSVIHRALTAVAIAVAALAPLLAVLGASWGELRWWVEYRTGLAARGIMSGLWVAQAGGAELPPPERIEGWSGAAVRLVGQCYPALVALALLVGLTVAVRLYHRLATRPHGVPPARFRWFRFSDQLGWAAAIPLVVVLVPKLAAAKGAAVNVLVISGALYAVRGAAVVAFALELVGAGGFLLSVLLLVIVVFMLPVVVGAAVVLGVLDAGLDLRRRWLTPPMDG